MDILFVADSLDAFKIYKDTTFSMMAEAARRGHRLYACEPADLALAGGIVDARSRRIEIVASHDYPGPDSWYRAAPAKITALSRYDVVLMRKDPPFDMEYVTATWLLEHAERQGARVFNKPRAIRDHSEKLATSEFQQFVPPTLVTRDIARLREFHEAHGDVILKLLDGMGGAGVFRIREDGMNLGSTIETLSHNGMRSVMAQKFVPAIAEGDKRILLIGGQAVPFVLARIPQGNEVRGNLAVGGIGVVRPLSEHDREIAETLGPILMERGLLLAGLDVIGDLLTEINVTSPTCFREISDQSGFDVSAMFIDRLELAAA